MSKLISDKLESSRILIYNSRDPEIALLLNKFGIDPHYISKGVGLYEQATKLVDQQRAEYREQDLIYDQFYVRKDEVQDNFNRTFKLIKVLSRKDKDLQDRLKVNEERVYAIEEWMEQALDFYKTLMLETEFLAALSKFNITPGRLKAEMQEVENLKLLRNKVMLEKGEAQEATRLRNDKLDELEDYCAELKGLAELALEKHPQLLEKLGILVRA